MKRRFGPYSDVKSVDVTALQADVIIHYMGNPKTTIEVDGSWATVPRVHVDFDDLNGGTALVLYNGRRGSVRVSNTGAATAGPGGFANSGFVGQAGGDVRVSRTGSVSAGPGGFANSGAVRGAPQLRTHVIRPNQPFRRTIDGAKVSVTMFVRSGTRVIY